MEVIIVVAAVWIFAKIVKALLRGYGLWEKQLQGRQMK